MEQGLKFFKHNGELLTDPTSYQRLIGRLLYLTHTHLDLRYSVHTLSQFMEAPRKTYLNVGRHIHWYIKAIRLLLVKGFVFSRLPFFS